VHRLLDNPRVVGQQNVAERSLTAQLAAECDPDAVTERLPRATAVAAVAAGPPTVVLRGGPLVVGALAVAALLAALHFGSVALAYGFPSTGFHVPEALKLNNEATVATWFSSFVDFVNAALLAVITAGAPRRERWRWAVTTLAVLGVSVDEVSGFHEDLSWVLHTTMHTTGLLTYAWVVPAALFVAAVGLLCVRMILARPGGLLVLLGGVVFVAGAAGVEVFEGWWVGATGETTDAVFLLLNGIEETMEMLGAIVTMAGLLRMAAGSGVRLAG